jgi:hypothetical protein
MRFYRTLPLIAALLAPTEGEMYYGYRRFWPSIPVKECYNSLDVRFEVNTTSAEIEIDFVAPAGLWFGIVFPPESNYYIDDWDNRNLMEGYAIVGYGGTQVDEMNLVSHTCGSCVSRDDYYTIQSTSNLTILTDELVNGNRHLRVSRALDTGDANDFQFRDPAEYAQPSCRPLLVAAAVSDMGEDFTNVNESDFHHWDSSYVYLYDQSKEDATDAFITSEIVFPVDTNLYANILMNFSEADNTVTYDANTTSNGWWAIGHLDLPLAPMWANLTKLDMMRADHTTMRVNPDLGTGANMHVYQSYGLGENCTNLEATCYIDDCAEIYANSTDSFLSVSYSHTAQVAVRRLDACGTHFNMKELTSCKPMTLATGFSRYLKKLQCSGDDLQHEAFYRQDTNFVTPSPTMSPTAYPTMFPSSTPTVEPTMSPTTTPTVFTVAPTNAPTQAPTATPTAPRLKYYGEVAFDDASGYSTGMSIFIWDDLFDNVTMHIWGPRTRAFFLTMGYKETTKIFAEEMEAELSGTPAYMLAPWSQGMWETTFTFNTTGDSAQDAKLSKNYPQNWYGQQWFASQQYPDHNETIFYRDTSSPDVSDFVFNFTNLVHPFWVCYVISDQVRKYTFVSSTYTGCGQLALSGNYRLRASFTTEDNLITIALNYDPFNETLLLEVTKPTTHFVTFGGFKTTNTTCTDCSKLFHVTPTRTFDFASVSYIINEYVLDQYGDTGQFVTTDKSAGSGRVKVSGRLFNYDINEVNSWVADGNFLVDWMSWRVIPFIFFYGIDSTPTDWNAEVTNGTGQLWIEYETVAPTAAPTRAPTRSPSDAPTRAPTGAPTQPPTNAPTHAPTLPPTTAPTKAPTQPPTTAPSTAPTGAPTIVPWVYQQLNLTGIDCDNIGDLSANIAAAWKSALQRLTDLSLDNNAISALLECLEVDSGSEGRRRRRLQDDQGDTIEISNVGVQLNILGEMEPFRYFLLYSLNSDIQATYDAVTTALAEEDGLEDAFLDGISYATADHVAADPMCEDLAYPRVCLEHLNSMFPSHPIFEVSLGIDHANSTITVREYFEEDLWFGFAFAENSSMWGDAYIYSKGFSGGQLEELRDYALEGHGNVLADAQVNIDIVSVTKANATVVVEWTRALNTGDSADDLVVNNTDGYLPVLFAYSNGTALALEYHGSQRGYTELLLVPSPDETDVVPAPVSADQLFSGSCLDGENDVFGYIDTIFHDIKVGMYIHCDTETFEIQIETRLDEWTGVVFNDEMIRSDAVIYTTGKDQDRDALLYAYRLTSKSLNGVDYQPDEDWTQLEFTERGTTVFMRYEKPLSATPWSLSTQKVVFRVAYGDSLRLRKHTAVSDTQEYDLINGERSTVPEKGEELAITHGVFMWIAWMILVPAGIFSSRNRDMFSDSEEWFKFHRIFMGLAVLFTIIGLIFGMSYVQSKNSPHFTRPHHILGLIVIIVAIGQPLNAIWRGHAPKKKGERKEMRRTLWEIVHKTSGYLFGWCCGMINCLVGVFVIDAAGPIIYIQMVFIVLVPLVIGAFEVRKMQNRSSGRKRDEATSSMELTAADANTASPRHGGSVGTFSGAADTKGDTAEDAAVVTTPRGGEERTQETAFVSED